MTPPLCQSCTEGPKGEAGHPMLVFYVGGPYPGHNIFRCALCDERWIRHYGSSAEPFAWTRYVRETRIPTSWPGRRRSKETA